MAQTRPLSWRRLAGLGAAPSQIAEDGGFDAAPQIGDVGLPVLAGGVGHAPHDRQQIDGHLGS